MTSHREEIFTDGSFSRERNAGGWAAVVCRTSSAGQQGGDSYEMELRAILAAVRMAEGPTTILSDDAAIISTIRLARTPKRCLPLWDDLYAAMEGKDITFDWSRRGSTLGQRIAHELARTAAKTVAA